MERLTDKGKLKACDSCVDGCPGCSDADKAIEKLHRYEIYDVEPEQIAKLIIDEEFWHKEAIRQAAELGELKMKINMLIESNMKH